MSEEDELQQNKRSVGRPPLFKDAEELKAKIEEYFNDPPDKVSIPTKGGKIVRLPVITITGLAIFLGFESRQSFYDYENREEFSYTIRRARIFIENEYEKMLHFGNTKGAIFALKNFGWEDKTAVDMNSKIQEMPTITHDGKPADFKIGD